MRVDHIAGRYYVHPREDVTHEPAYPGDVAEVAVVAWELWADAKQDARGNWTCDWLDDFDTEADAVAEAHRRAAAAGVSLPRQEVSGQNHQGVDASGFGEGVDG